jgi:hypothetical protein
MSRMKSNMSTQSIKIAVDWMPCINDCDYKVIAKGDYKHSILVTNVYFCDACYNSITWKYTDNTETYTPLENVTIRNLAAVYDMLESSDKIFASKASKELINILHVLPEYRDEELDYVTDRPLSIVHYEENKQIIIDSIQAAELD